jgi:hypothetical protein
MKHHFFNGLQIRTGTIRGMFCYQPFTSGRLGKAVPLFPSSGDIKQDHEFFEANFEPVFNDNGDFSVIARLEIRRYRE